MLTACAQEDPRALDDREEVGIVGQSLAVDANLGSALGWPLLQGTTCSAGDDFAAGCNSGGAPDRVYTWTAPSSGDFIFSTAGSAYDTVLQVLNAEQTSSLGCNDEADNTLQSSVKLGLAAGQKVTIVVDGYSAACGSFKLNIASAPSSRVVFAQGFNSCSSLACYVSADPNQGQFNDLSAEATGGTWSINAAGQLQIVRGTSTAADNGAGFTRWKDFPGSPTVLHMTFELGAKNLTSFQNDAVVLDIGNINSFLAYGSSTPVADTFSRLHIDGSGAGTFKFDLGSQSRAFTASGNVYAVSYLLNRSGVTQIYRAPDSSTAVLDHGCAALWVGDELLFANVCIFNGGSSDLSNMKLQLSKPDGGTWLFDNIVVRDELPQ